MKDIRTSSVGDIGIVRQLPDTLTFVSDSQDVSAVYDHLPTMGREYDALFVEVLDGEYGQVWGMCGIVPYLSKLVRRIK